MVRYGYDFYENDILNGVFKRLVSVAAKGISADLNATAIAAVVVDSPVAKLHQMVIEECERKALDDVIKSIKLNALK
jgi:hypothetical protein